MEKEFEIVIFWPALAKGGKRITWIGKVHLYHFLAELFHVRVSKNISLFCLSVRPSACVFNLFSLLLPPFARPSVRPLFHPENLTECSLASWRVWHVRLFQAFLLMQPDLFQEESIGCFTANCIVQVVRSFRWQKAFLVRKVCSVLPVVLFFFCGLILIRDIY